MVEFYLISFNHNVGLVLLTPGCSPVRVSLLGAAWAFLPPCGDNPRSQATWRPPKKPLLRNPAQGMSSPATKRERRALGHLSLTDLRHIAQMKTKWAATPTDEKLRARNTARNPATPRYCASAPSRASRRARALPRAHAQNLGGGAQDEGLLPLSPAGPIQAALGNVFNYISQKPLRPWPSGSVSGSGDRIWLSHTQAVLVTMEEIGILVEKAQVWWGRARGEGWGWAATCLGSLVTAGVSPWVWVI